MEQYGTTRTTTITGFIHRAVSQCMQQNHQRVCVPNKKKCRASERRDKGQGKFRKSFEIRGISEIEGNLESLRGGGRRMEIRKFHASHGT